VRAKEHGAGGAVRPVWLVVVVLLSLPVQAQARGLESTGNTDGVLTWSLGRLGAGQSRTRTVIFSYADSYAELLGRLKELRRAGRIEPDSSATCTVEQRSGIVRLRNGLTDIALGPNGAFFWEGTAQALGSSRGGQLSRLGYYIHYLSDVAGGAGTSITRGGGLENLCIVEPAQAAGHSGIRVRARTLDGKVGLEIRAMVASGPVAAVEFTVTNNSAAELKQVRLSVYSNLESAHSHANDYSMLDSQIGGLLVLDPPSGICVAMAGLTHAAAGYCGIWPSERQLRGGEGVAFEQWKASAGSEGPAPSVGEGIRKRLLRASMPHPPAPYIEPAEPPTRTLSPAEAAAALEADWLFQADGNPTPERIRAEITWARQLAARLATDPRTPDLAGPLKQLDELGERLARIADSAGAEDLRRLYVLVRAVKRGIAFENPLLDFDQVLFIDNPYPQGTEWRHQARHRNGMMAVPGGRLLVLEGLQPGGRVCKLAPKRPGSFWRPDLSFDARKVLFCYKAHDEKAFHLYEIGIDGTGLRQLTFGPYDDIDPIYLPDGHIMFSSTRANTYIRCMPYTYCYVLARCDADGRNIYLVSRNNETDWLPTLLNDGRVIYSRWEYHDKALWRIQSLWTTNQDGTGTAAFWGNQSVWPDHLAEARPIPGSRRVMFTGLAHHNWFAGSIGMLDPRKGFNFPHGLTKVTADVPWPECGRPPLDPHESDDYHPSGKFTAYKSPYPLSEEDFLVSAERQGKFRLYLMDVYGNRELIYEGAHNIWYALPVRPRPRPPVHADRVTWPEPRQARKKVAPGVFYNPDVYQGVPEIPRGTAKYLRVIEMDARTYSSWTRDGRFSGPVVSLVQDDGVKRILGTVPIEADGSVFFRAPAGLTLHFQLLDEQYRALQTMRSFSGLMPGECRSCIGCHEMHSTAGHNKKGMALKAGPAELTPPPWGTKSISYTRFVQPVLDRYCGKCHQGDGKARKKLDLTLRPGYKMFKEPYVTLVGGARYSGVDPKKKGIAGAIMAENYEQSDPRSYVTLRPMQHLSYTSRLIEIASSGRHNGVKVDSLSLRKLIAWVDTNCPYRGEEDIRAIPDPDFPGIEELPVRPRVATAPTIVRP